jgi:hypothetical protein
MKNEEAGVLRSEMAKVAIEKMKTAEKAIGECRWNVAKRNLKAALFLIKVLDEADEAIAEAKARANAIITGQ